MDQTPQAVHYIPILTTILSASFCFVLLSRYRAKGRGAHLLWWAAGVFWYGVGTGLESTVTLFGNSELLTKSWYVAGAVLGGYPLAQGSVYLLHSRRMANTLSAITLPVIVIVSVLVFMSPFKHELMDAHRPAGKVLEWTWVRAMTPIINLYAAFFLIGGAAVSAWRYFQHRDTLNRAIGNTLICIGALLPGIGGSMAKMDIVEALYIGEFAGLILIWAGYAACVRGPRVPKVEITRSPAELALAESKASGS